jgi:ABC-type glutathione transport system ATPase component
MWWRYFRSPGPKKPKKILKTIVAEKKTGRGQGTGAISNRLLAPATTLDTATAGPLRYIFEAKGIAKKFDDGQVQALRGVNFRVSQGDFLAVTGPSGC